MVAEGPPLVNSFQYLAISGSIETKTGIEIPWLFKAAEDLAQRYSGGIVSSP